MDWRRFSSQRMLSFFSIGTRVGLIFFLSAACPFELLARPELHRRQSQRQPISRHRKAGMHQHPADRVMAKAAALVLATVDALRHADQMRRDALIGELGRVLDQKDSAPSHASKRARVAAK